MPALYDLAFGYRNYEEEVDFLVEQHQLLHEGQPPRRVLELAAGPARHCLEALQQSYIQTATALDVSTEMIEYAKELASEELDNTYSFEYIQGDMTNFDANTVHATNSEDAFDSAWILLGSLQHLTTNEEVQFATSQSHRIRLSIVSNSLRQAIEYSLGTMTGK